MTLRARAPLAVAALLGARVLVEPRLASANVGTALMWAGGLHLMFGNALIGVIEGLLLARLWRAGALRATLLMIAGNYLAWWSYVLLEPAYQQLIAFVLGDAPLQRVRGAIALTMALAFTCSLVLEAPFAYLVFRSGAARNTAAHPGRRFLLGHVVAQGVTYVLLVLWYGMASNTSLLRIPVAEVASRLPAGWLYFDDASGRCARRRLSGGSIERCPEPRTPADSVFTAPAVSLDPSSPWTVLTGDWGVGVSASHRDGRDLFVALATPSVLWHATHATLLPRGVVVYQLGDQIVALDLEQPAIASLVRGRRPTVELD